MLTELELYIVKKFLRILCRYGFVDLDFKENTDRPLQRTKSKWKRPFLLARTVFSICYLAFVISRIPVTLRGFKERKRFDDCVIHGLLILFRLGSLVNHTTSVVSVSVIAELLNNIFSLNTRFGLLHFNNKFLEPNMREKLLRTFVILVTAASFFSTCLFLANSDSPGYLFSLLTNEYRNEYFNFMCFFILEFLVSIDLVLFLITLILIEFVYIFSAKYWLVYLCSNRQRSSDEDEMEVCDPESEDSRNSSLNLYHQLYILNTLQGLAFGTLCLPMYKLMIGLASTITFYAFVKLGHKLNVFLYLFVLVCLPGCYIVLIPATYAMSEMYNLSSKYQSEQLRVYLNIAPSESMTKVERKLFLRNNKSTAIIRCQVGSLYWMEKDAKATLVQLLVSATSNLLLTFK